MVAGRATPTRPDAHLHGGGGPLLPSTTSHDGPADARISRADPRALETLTMKIGRIAGLAASGTLFLTLALVSGCGGDGEAKPVPAAGTVTFDGQPLENGYVQFIPEKGRPAAGAIKGGKFTLSTTEDGDGAIPGKHMVSVKATKQVTVKGETEPQEVSILPDKYSTAATSGLAVEIPSGGNKDIKLELTK